jgi:hypothetical protein
MTSIRPNVSGREQRETRRLCDEASFTNQSPLSAKLRYDPFPELYEDPNKVTKQGNEVMSATWAVPIRCVSFRKLEKRAIKAA